MIHAIVRIAYQDEFCEVKLRSDCKAYLGLFLAGLTHLLNVDAHRLLSLSAVLLRNVKLSAQTRNLLHNKNFRKSKQP